MLVRGVHWLFPDFAFMWLVEEAKKNMPLELNFLNEGHNSEIVSNKLAHLTFLKVNTFDFLFSHFWIMAMKLFLILLWYVDMFSLRE